MGALFPTGPGSLRRIMFNVVAVTEDGHFICFRQVKSGLEGTTLAIVGGFVEADEAPLAAAKRELLEETGCRSADWVHMGSYRVDPNRRITIGHLCLARRALFIAQHQAVRF